MLIEKLVREVRELHNKVTANGETPNIVIYVTESTHHTLVYEHYSSNTVSVPRDLKSPRTIYGYPVFTINRWHRVEGSDHPDWRVVHLNEYKEQGDDEKRKHEELTNKVLRTYNRIVDEDQNDD